MADLFEGGGRCERPEIPHLGTCYDVTEDDDRGMRRRKWNLRAMDIWLTPCTRNPTGRAYDCPRCTKSYLDTIDRPQGPWAR